MPAIDPRVDAYIAKSAEFAQAILTHLRAVVHATCPDVEETIKWGFPHFMYKGMMCSMASFKAHCAFGFWKAELLMADDARREAMGDFGRITSLKDLPPKKTLATYIRQAMKLNDDGVAAPARAKPATPRALEIPDDLSAALDASPEARRHFDAFSPSKQRDYAEWLTEAKTEATRARRREQAIAWIAEGKARNWKYEKC
ncbi:YdeI/OmpD-associated family protein [Duganella sp. sic0402]|uniref:YdeI/OmpD-associated family protein n=1 Tax=Duganella sp. sic0402 TaxID=2854786 RepID=UPI001C49029F|nr:YdeI/OmpD-associated family protein [Duganella sp. sic0402]MBV7536639.1 YdeI/OmpD-associated family protein [Duganella sp. sic0402]